MKTELAVQQARTNLTMFVMGQARAMEAQGNVMYRAAPDAPESYEALQAHFYDAWAVGGTIKISDAYSDNTVYTSRTANHASRFWHDCLHFLHRLDFTLDSEIRVGLKMVQAVARHYGSYSVEAELMYMDTVAMSLYHSEHGRFPANQWKFIQENMK